MVQWITLVVKWSNLIYITYEILERWVELVLGSETSRLTKTVKIEEFLEDIARVEVLSG